MLLVSMLSGVVNVHGMERPNGFSIEDWEFLKRVRVPRKKESIPCVVSGCGHISYSTSECITHAAVHAQFRLMQQRQAQAQQNTDNEQESVGKTR